MSPLASPLSGRSVVVTRASHQAPPTLLAVEQRGGKAVSLPCLELLYHADVVQHALLALQQQQQADLLITSCNGVESLLSQASADDLRSWIQQRRVIAVGNKTANALQRLGICNVAVPEIFSQQGVAAWWDAHGWPQQLLFVRAQHGRDDLLPLLHQHGCALQLFASYSNRIPASPAPPSLLDPLQAGDIDAVLLGSSATARGWVARVGLELARKPVLVAISPRVAESCTSLGLRVQVVAMQASFDAMLDQLGEYFGGGA